uniref:Kelch-like protein 6-like n=1 Tax=Saccoglossus kowalevskii TaxID=10224 RepID=A0ABM0MS83_SACKO|nr:PREDICTED: kelch-like protein 6-like [Saccoglossus kowalevskii]
MSSILEDQILMKAEVEETPYNIVVSSQVNDLDYSSSRLDEMNVARKKSKLTDVVLDVGGTEFPCHKVVLATSCTYFKGMFDSGMKECQQRKISIKAIEATTMGSLLDYFYTGKTTITSCNVQSVLRAANFFQVLTLRDKCAKFLITNMNAETCLDIWQMMVSLSLSFSEQAKIYVLDHFKLVCKLQQFLELTQEELIELISDEHLAIDRENQAGSAVLDWFHYDEDSRRHYFVEILQHVRLELITSLYLVKQIGKELSKVTPKTTLVSKLEGRLTSSDRTFENQKPRETNNVVCFIGAVLDGQKAGDINYFNPINNAWSHLTTNTSSLKGSAVVYDNSIVTRVSKGIHTFNMDTREWNIEVDELIDGDRDELKMILVDERIYFIGGRFHAYDLNKKREVLVEPMLKKVEGTCAVAYGGKIYVFGGRYMHYKETEMIQCYDPNSDTWMHVGDLPEEVPKKDTVAVVFDQFIYLFKDASTIYVYDPKRYEWLRAIPGLETDTYHGRYTATVCNNKIYIISGIISVYDPIHFIYIYTLDPFEGVLELTTKIKVPSPYSSISLRPDKHCVTVRLQS